MRKIGYIVIIIFGLLIIASGRIMAQNQTNLPCSNNKSTKPCAYVIKGVVFIDSNQNGSKDVNEASLGNPTITVVGAQNRYVTYNVKGTFTYAFLNLTAKTYDVVLKVPNGYYATTPTSRNVTIGPINEVIVNFAIAPITTPTPIQPTSTPIPTLPIRTPTPVAMITAPSPTPTSAPRADFTVSGVVFVDTNKNRVQDAGEAGYGGINVLLVGPISRTTTTDSQGRYVFTDLTSANYGTSIRAPQRFTTSTFDSKVMQIGTSNPSPESNFGMYKYF